MNPAIPVGFAILAAILCWFLAHAKGSWWLKAALIVLLTGFGLETWRALDSYAGWPARETLPKRSLLISAMVREPNPSRNDPGAIFVWVQPLSLPDTGAFTYRPVSGEPRAYRLRYTRTMHESVAQAMQAMREDGRPIVLERDGLPNEGGDGQGRSLYGEEDDGLRLYDLPPPDMPPKPPLPGGGH